MRRPDRERNKSYVPHRSHSSSVPGTLQTQVKEMVPDMVLAQKCWVAVSKEDPAEASGIMETVKERSMGPWYAHLSQNHPALFPLDEALLSKMKEANEAEAKRISEVGLLQRVDERFVCSQLSQKRVLWTR